MTEGELTPAIEVGGTHVTAGLVDVAGHAISGQVRASLDANGTAEAIIGRILQVAGQLDAPGHARWGVALPGPFDYARGIARYHGVGKFDALNGTDFRQVLGTLPSKPETVSFLNDAHAFLLGEWRFGAARGEHRCAGITLGTGVGSAFLADGQLVTSGGDVPPGGRADLLTINGRPLEDTVSRRAIRAAYRRHDGQDPDVDRIAELARAGDQVAGKLLRATFTELGRALGPWLTRFGASVLVVGGAMTGSLDIIGPPLLAALPDTVETRLAAHPRDAALLGAAACAASHAGLHIG
jgi:glucokinase